MAKGALDKLFFLFHKTSSSSDLTSAAGLLGLTAASAVVAVAFLRFWDVKELDAHDLTLMFDQRRQKRSKLVFGRLLASNLCPRGLTSFKTGLFCRHTGEVGQPSPTPFFLQLSSTVRSCLILYTLQCRLCLWVAFGLSCAEREGFWKLTSIT